MNADLHASNEDVYLQIIKQVIKSEKKCKDEEKKLTTGADKKTNEQIEQITKKINSEKKKLKRS